MPARRSIRLLVFRALFLVSSWELLGSGAAAAPAPPTGAARTVVAVFPFENLSGVAVPVKEFRAAIIEQCSHFDIALLPEEKLEAFISRYRVRYSGGMDQTQSQALLAETGAQAVLFTSVELYSEAYPPKIAFTNRLVGTGEGEPILWTFDTGRTGDQAPGWLQLGLIKDLPTLRRQACTKLCQALARFLTGQNRHPGFLHRSKRFAPQKHYRSRAFLTPKQLLMPAPRNDKNGVQECPPSALLAEQAQAEDGAPTSDKQRLAPSEERSSGHEVAAGLPAAAPDAPRHPIIAVLPFYNQSSRRAAGEIIALQFVNGLSRQGDYNVLEPGIVRDSLLNLRIIMDDGISLADAQSLFDRLGVDFLLAGKILDYQDYEGETGTPKVDFSVAIFAKADPTVVFQAKSCHQGDDHVFWFKRGLVTTAHALAALMVDAVVRLITM